MLPRCRQLVTYYAVMLICFLVIVFVITQVVK